MKFKGNDVHTPKSDFLVVLWPKICQSSSMILIVVMGKNSERGGYYTMTNMYSWGQSYVGIIPLNFSTIIDHIPISCSFKMISTVGFRYVVCVCVCVCVCIT